LIEAGPTDRLTLALSLLSCQITSNPETFTGLATALSVPKFMFNVWAAICAFQALSIAKSALASDGNELSQADITATAAGKSR